MQTVNRQLKTGWAIFFDLCCTSLPFTLGILLFFPLLTLGVNHSAAFIIHKLLPSLEIQIHETPFLCQRLSFLSFPCGETTLNMKLVFGAIGSSLILITRNINLAIPYKLIAYFFACLFLLSSIVSLLFPNAFPYTIGTFAESTMKLQVLLLINFPLMLGILLLQITPTMMQKIGFMFSLLGLTLLLSTVKYAFCLYALVKCSFILTPILFFIFGPYMDLVYVVAFFALFTSRLKT